MTHLALDPLFGRLHRKARSFACWARVAGAALLWFGGGQGVALAEGSNAVVVADDRGTAVHLAQPARRVVSLLPSLTETVCVLGACDRLVAVDRWSSWPDTVQRLPRVGGLDDADIERIVAQRPDLVVAAPSSKVALRLRSLGIPVAEFDAQSVEGVRRVTMALGRLLGVTPQAEKLWARLQTQRAQARQGVPVAAQGLRVYFELGPTPYAAGEASYIGELLAGLGVRNVVPASLGAYPQLNPEFVVRAQPDVIILTRADAPLLETRPGWKALAAVRQGRVCAMPPSDFDIVVRPGPRLGDAAQLLSHCLAAVALRGSGGSVMAGRP